MPDSTITGRYDFASASADANPSNGLPGLAKLFALLEAHETQEWSAPLDALPLEKQAESLLGRNTE